jgi:glycosyltransferase involved in cell wall biosynthesis
MLQRKKKCLLILSRIPYPPVGGDRLKSYHLIGILSKHYDLNVIVITDESANQPEAKQFLEKHTESYKIFSFPKYRFYLNALRGVLGREPLQVAYYFFGEVKRYVDSQMASSDFVIANLIRTAKYVLQTHKPKFLDIVDSIAINYRNAIDKVSSVFWKSIYKIEAPRISAFEEECIRRFNATFFVNKTESEYWKDKGKVRWIPNGVNPKLFKYNNTNDKYSNVIVFFGKMDYQPNIDAVVWYMNNVHSLVNKDVLLYIVGIHPTAAVYRFMKENSNVVVTGFIDDPYEIIKSALAVIAPMQTGAGIQNKILESMALEKIVITTSLAAQPIVGAQNKVHLLIADEPAQFAEYINELHQNGEVYKEIAQNAGRLVADYSWNRYEISLNALIEEEFTRKD